MKAKILVVDDESDLESLVRQKFRKKIRSQEYEFIFAGSGVEALEKLRSHSDVDVVITDLNMPEMDGLELLANLDRIGLLLKTIVISAYGDLGNIRKAMNCGAFDFLTKPINFPDLEITLEKTLQQVRQIKETLRLRQQKEEELRRSEAYAREKAEQLEKALQDLQQTQAQLIQTEKMSSMGLLVAGVAHEINNPMNFIHGNLPHIQRYAQDVLRLLELYQQHDLNSHPEIEQWIEEIELEFMIEDLPQLLDSMKLGTERIRQIVMSLRTFSRCDEAEMKPVSIHAGLDSTLVILQHRLKAKAARKAIKITKKYGELPKVECYAGQLNQVFMNIINNAIDAVEERAIWGTREEDKTPFDGREFEPCVEIYSEKLNPDWVRIAIADNGCGIPHQDKAKLFDPFFTTKPVGRGTGLGLSISYQIVVEKHGGVINCISEPGVGTKFQIDIPIRHNITVSGFDRLDPRMLA